MDNKNTSNQYDGEEVVEVEAVEVAVDPAQTVNEDKGTVEEVLPPFLERDARVREGAQAEDLQASEVEPDTQGEKVRAEETQDGSISLFDDGAAPEYRRRWMDIQARFVDDPRASVRDADELVEQVVKHITDTFARQRNELESHWNSGDGDNETSTEDLRLAVKRYHTLFDQLLNLKP